MTLDDLLSRRVERERHLADIGIKYNQANTKRREIEAQYILEWKSKPKSEALFIINHKEDWENYQKYKEELITAQSDEDRASKVYYHARDWHSKGDQVDSAISQLMKDNF